MKKTLLFLLLSAVFSLSAAVCNYALRSNGGTFIGPVNALRAIDGNPKTYWGVDPYPRTMILKLKGAYKIDRIRLLFPKGGPYTFEAFSSLDNRNYTPLVSGTAKDVFEKQFPERSMQFLKLTMVRNAANRGVHLCELELCGPAGQKPEQVKFAPAVSLQTQAAKKGGRPDFLKTSLLPVKVTASSFVTIAWNKRECHEPRLVSDGEIGNDRSYWAPDFLAKARPPHWVEFDFGRPRTFSAVRLDMIERYNLSALVNDFKVAYFDGKKYVPVVDVKGHCSRFFQAVAGSDPALRYGTATPEAHLKFKFPPVTAQKVRFITTDEFARLDEMTFFEKEFPAEKKKVAPPRVKDGVVRLSFAPEKALLAPGFVRPRLEGKVFYFDRLLPDGVRRFGAYGKENVLTLDLAPGFYRVWAVGGDLFAPAPGAVLLAGKERMTLDPVKKGDFFQQWGAFEVKHSPVRLRLKGPWLLNALIIAPAAEGAAFEKAAAQAALGKLAPVCQRDLQSTHTAKPLFKGDHIWYSVPAEKRIFSRTTPEKNAGMELKGTAFPGSVKVFTPVFFSKKDFSGLTVSAGDLRCGKKVLKVKVHPVRCDFQRTGHKGTTKKYDLIPEILDKNTPRFVPRNSSLQYYLLVDVPSDAAPGVYSGTLKWNKGSFPIRLEVLKVRIDELFPRQSAAFYCGNGVRNSMGDPKYRTEWLDRLKEWRKYNLNMVFFPGVKFVSKEQFARDYAYVNALLDEAGFPRTVLPYHRSDLNVEAVRSIVEISKKGPREIIFYPVDEPFNNKQSFAMKLYPLIKSVPGARTYSTVFQRDVDMFGKYLDFRAYNISRYSGFLPEQIHRQCKAANGVFFWDSNSSREYPDVCRFKAGFFQYKTGAAGQTYWAYNSPNDDAFNDFDAREHDHNTVYESAVKRYSTIQYEAIREGLDDLRLCYTLERLAAERASSPKAAEAKKLLAKIKADTVNDLALYKKHFGSENEIHQRCFWSAEKFDFYREALLKLIAELQK